MQRMDLRHATGAERPVIGMVHLLALPGAPGHDNMSAVLAAACRDADALTRGGVDALMIENYGDVPFYPDVVPPVTIAALARAVLAVRDVTDLPLGVNVLRNDARSALAVAAVTGARFIRVNVHSGAMLTDQGWITGQAHATLRDRQALGAPVAIWADVMVKHAVPPHGLQPGEAAQDTWHRGLADALIVSGSATGAPASVERLRAVRAAVPDAPLLIGSGLSADNAGHLLAHADGAIVGSAFQADGRAGGAVEPDRVRRLLDVLRAASD